MTVPGSPSASNGASPKAAETPHTAMKVQGMIALAPIAEERPPMHDARHTLAGVPCRASSAAGSGLPSMLPRRGMCTAIDVRVSRFFEQNLQLDVSIMQLEFG